MNDLSSSASSSRLVQTLASYLPRYQLRFIARGSRPSTEPSFENRAGAVLLVDVSGFTALTERFAAQGTAGAEQLSGILNRYFGQIADLITARGGDILAFAGDSALAMWPCDESDGESDLTACVLRATQAALNIQAELDRYEPVPGVTIRQRAGIGSGALQLMELGGVSGRWQFVVTGDAIARAALANQEAQSGEVVLAAEACKLAATRLRGTTLSSGRLRATEIFDLTSEAEPPERGTVIPESAPNLVPNLAPYLPAVVSARLAAGQDQWIAEFRTLTVLFLNLAGFSIRSLDTVEALHRHLQFMQQTLDRLEGTLYQFLMDDKGLTAVCAFGLPPLAHENDPRRAVEAGIALHEELRHRGISSSIGIATGSVFCGVYGSDNRRQYTALGNAMNLAARLMQAAQGSILCDDATRRSAASLHFQAKGELTVKGRSATVPVFIPSLSADHDSDAGSATTLSSDSVHHLVGREAERSILSKALAALLDQGKLDQRKSCCVILEGEAGVGKSCLLDHLSRQIGEIQQSGRTVSCLRAAADSIQQSTPYHVWRAIFRQILPIGILPINDRSSPAQAEQILAQLPPHVLPLAPLLNAVMPLNIPENATTKALQGEARAENTQHLLIEILKAAAARSPLCILLEDVHWFDSPSLRLALLAAQQVAPLLFVLSTRPFPAPPPEFTALLDLPAQHLILSGLAPDLASQAVCQHLGASHLPPEIARFIEQRAGGNPLFSQQLAYALRDAGVIKIAGGKCEIAETAGSLDSILSATRFPSTVEGVITSRLDRMPAALSLTVKVASVLGQNFALSTLAGVYPVETPGAQLDSSLDEIAKLDLIQRDLQRHTADNADPAYSFKHAVIQDVAYNAIPHSQRRQLHQSAAQWCETRFQSDLEAQYPLLAHHWSHAEVLPKAIHYCSEAGAQALRNHANPEAVRFLSQALQFEEKETKETKEGELSRNHHDDRTARRAGWELQLGTAYVNWSRYVEGRDHLERGLALQRQAIPASQLSAAAALFTEVARQCTHRALPGRYLSRCSNQREALLNASGNLAALTEIYFHRSDPLRTLYSVFRSLNLAELAGPSPELARGYSYLGSLLGFLTLHRAANAYFARAWKVAEDIDDPASRVSVTIARTAYYTGVGRWQEATGLLDEAITISDRLGDRRRSDDCGILSLLIKILEGRFGESLDLANSLYSSAKQRLNSRIQSEALYGKGWCLRELNRLDELQASVDELDSLRTAQLKIGGRHQKQDVHCLYALLHFDRGDVVAARREVDLAVQALTRNSFYNDILVHSAITEVYLGLWQHARAAGTAGNNEDHSNLENSFRRACAALARYNRIFPIGKPLLYLRQGQYLWAKEQPAKAIRNWQSSLKAATGLQAEYYQGVAHLDLALHLPASDPLQAQHQSEASEILSKLGAVHDLARLAQADS